MIFWKLSLVSAHVISNSLLIWMHWEGKSLVIAKRTPPPLRAVRSHRKIENLSAGRKSSWSWICVCSQVSVRASMSALQVSIAEVIWSRLLITLRMLVKRIVTCDSGWPLPLASTYVAARGDAVARLLAVAWCGTCSLIAARGDAVPWSLAVT